MPSNARGDDSPGDRLGNALATTARSRAQAGVPLSNRRTLPAGTAPVDYRRPTVAPAARIHRRRRTRVGRFVHLHRRAVMAAAVVADAVFYIAAILAACLTDYPSARVLIGINLIGLGVLAAIVAWSRRD